MALIFFPRPFIEIKKGLANWRSLNSKITDSKLKYQHHATSTKLFSAKRYHNKLSQLDLLLAPHLAQIKFDHYTLHMTLPRSLPSEVVDYFDQLEAFFYILRSYGNTQFSGE